MANTGNTQQQINYGAAVNDGNGDPLRTAFIKTDDNFDNVWLAGPVGSNITITNNTVQVNNTNGNLILSPNGVGVIQTNSRLLPRLNNTYDFGSTTLKYRTGYFGAGGLVIDGNVTVAGNLTAGNIAYTGNVFVGDLQGSVYADDSTIMVDAVDNELFAGRATISGNVSATYFTGNGSLLTGIATSYGNANVVANLAALGNNPISTTGNVTANYFLGNGRQLTGVVSSYGNTNVAAYLTTYTGNLAAGNLTVSSGSDTWTMSGQFLTGPGGAYWHSHPEQSSDDFVSAPGSDIRIQSVDANSVVESQISLTSTNIEIIVVNGVTKTWRFNESGTSEIPGDIVPVVTVGASASVGNIANPWNNAYISGNINSGNVSAAGNVTASYFIGNGSQLTSLPAPAVTQDITSNGAMSIMTYDGVIKYVSYATVEPSSGNIAAGNISTTGNVTGNYFIGNGSQLTGISTANTGNVTFSGEAVIGTGTSNTVSGLYLAPDPVSLTNDLYLRVRGNIQDEPTHIHFDTGNNQYYNQFIGDDNKYIQLANTGNIVINTSDYVGNTAQWNFSTDGVLTLPNADATGFGNIYFEENSSTITFGLDDNTTPYLYSFSTSGITLPRGGATIRDTVGNALAFGRDAAATGPQGNAAIAIGQQAGDTSQGASSVAIGYKAGLNTQGDNSVAIGTQAGQITQGQFAVAIGDNAGNNAQGTDAVAIGASAGLTAQGNGAVAIGPATATTSQGDNAVAIGDSAGEVSQGEITVAIGYLAGQTIQGNAAVAVGAGAGTNTQGLHAVAIGTDAGATTQGNRAVAIGYLAGSIAQGNSAVAIGYYAGELNQGNNSIIINATGVDLQQTTANTFTVAPVRNDVANTAEVMFYNTTSKEITYGNTISVVGNITSGNLTVGSGTITGGNVNGATFNGNVAFGTGTVGGSGNITGGNISAIGNVAAGNISAVGNIIGNTAGFAIGYRDIPQVSLAANVTTALSDAGKHYYSTSASNLALTIANNSSVSWAVGTAISIVNRGTANITVVQGSGVSLYLAGNATAANRTVTTYGMATVLNVAANVWMINGTGLS